MSLALEPLRYEVTNFINTLSDVAELCKYIAHGNVGRTLNFFHFHSNGEDLATVSDAKELLLHAHLARPNPDKKTPKSEDIEVCRAWANALRAVGYDNRISVEAVFERNFVSDAKNTYYIMKMFR